MFKKLYAWTLSMAQSRHAPVALGLVAFAESSFFPIPPDTILVPMSIARPNRALVYALICTVASVAGGILGYGIGALLFQTIGKWLISLYGYGHRVDEIKAFYAHYGWLVILLKGFTPIPFKIISITSGLLAYSLPLFILFSIITRAARFFFVAAVLNRFGGSIHLLLEKYFGFFLAALLCITLLGFWVAGHMV